MAAKKLAPKSALERAIEKKRVCFGKLEKAVKELKELERYAKRWAAAVARRKPQQIADTGDLWFMMRPPELGAEDLRSAWNVLVTRDPAICLAFHAAATKFVSQAITAKRAEVKRLSKEAC